MPAFEWKHFFSVGDDVLDGQHQRLFEIANELYDAIKENGIADEDLLRSSIARLGEYTRLHFAEEERLMRQAGYPDLQRHQEAHAALVAKIENFETRAGAGETRLAAELLPFLVGEWLASHIAFEDQQYAGYINSFACRDADLRRRYRSLRTEAA